jgi:hypothetical protein
MTVETGGMTLSNAAESTADPAAGAAGAEAAGAEDTGAEDTGAPEGTEAAPEDGAVAAGEAEASAPAGAAGDPAAAGPVLAVDAAITADQQTAIYGEPSVAAPRFGVYDAGTTFTVIEAGGDYTEYPVEVDGRRWYRVRAPDGLAGWLVEP